MPFTLEKIHSVEAERFNFDDCIGRLWLRVGDIGYEQRISMSFAIFDI